MRYLWGLAVGHAYTHERQCTDAGVVYNPEGAPEPADQDICESSQMNDVSVNLDTGTDGSGSDTDDVDYEPTDEDDDEESDFEDDDWEDIEEMYGDGDWDSE